MNTKLFTLRRTSDNGTETLGELSGNGFFCKTLERPYKNNASMISAIPKGLYDVLWTFSPQLLRYTFEVQKVPGRSGIRIHKGNYFFNVEGCILLGDSYGDLNKDGQLDILNSTVTIKKLEDFMQKQPFKLQIV